MITRLLQFVIIIFGGYLLLVAVVRLLPAPSDQRRAVALLEQPIPPVRGRDAVHALWLQNYDVPVESQEKVGAALLAYYRDDPSRGQAPVGPGHPLASYSPLTEVPGEGSGTCEQRKPGCLAYVRSDPARVQATLAAHSRGLASALGLQRFDGMRYGLDPTNLVHSIQPFGSQRRLVNTHYAALFATGQRAPALAGLCDDIAAWRRLGADSDSLIGSMIAAGTVRRDVLLLGEMLAELPAGETLPASCTDALAIPTDAELDMCPAMKTEFAFSRSQANVASDTAMTRWQRQLSKVFLHQRDFEGRSALALSTFCGAHAIEQMRADRPTNAWPNRSPEQCGTFASIVNPYGCLLIAIGGGSGFGPYVDRRTDQAAILALARTVVWLRQQNSNAAEWPALLKQRPASLALRREPSLSADGRSLSIPLLSKPGDESFALQAR